MSSLRMLSNTMLHVFVAILLLATVAAAGIPGLCNTGETAKTATGCTGVLVTPNPPGGGPNLDGNWGLASPYPSTFSSTQNPCSLTSFESAWVDTPNAAWLANSASAASEWITPYDGENPLANGWYVYLTAFHVPAVLPSGSAPAGITINGRLASDNPTYQIYMASPANGGSCAVVTGPPVPINPAGGL